MSYQIALSFEDGVTRVIDCDEGELVSDAAYRQRINIPLDCRDGACGTCKCKAESGKYELEDYIEDALTEEEAEEGHVLTCRMVPSSNCVIAVPASSKSCKTGVEKVESKIQSVSRFSETAIGFEVHAESINKLSFLPGQYVNIRVPDTDEVRAYSFSSLITEENTVSFLIRVIPDGKMSSFMRDKAQKDDVLELSGPYGSFYLREVNRPQLFLAGGTGLAPFLAMLDQINKEGSEHPVHLIYGVTNDIDLVEVDKLEKFESLIPNFSYRACIASEESDFPHKGYVTDHIEDNHLNDGEVDIYLCGPPLMVDAVSQYCKQQEIEPSSFYYEKFS